tara:strand:- start:350 stop:472 length:123 start_codon:yes stop_codon:yes gene_type:complete
MSTLQNEIMLENLFEEIAEEFPNHSEEEITAICLERLWDA